MEVLDVLSDNILFARISRDDLPSLLSCLGVRKKRFSPGESPVLMGDEVRELGLMLSGEAHITKTDDEGTRIILSELGRGDIFGEALACAGIESSPVSVTAQTDCEIMFLPIRRVVTSCASACAFHVLLIENLLRLIAEKNILLSGRIDILSKKTTREKLLQYLSGQADKTGKGTFLIPFSRDELADYLCVNRSAMSRELCRMRDEGLIKFERSRFTLLKY